MAEVKDGGPAFPIPGQHGTIHDGMSLRDWFAGQAISTRAVTEMRYKIPSLVQLAYEIADEALRVRVASSEDDVIE